MKKKIKKYLLLKVDADLHYSFKKYCLEKRVSMLQKTNELITGILKKK